MQADRLVAAAVLLSSLLLSSCSSNFFYDKLDTLIVWQVQDYVRLTDPQKRALKADLQVQLDFIRRNEMPRAARLFERSARDLEAGDVTAALLDARYYEALELYDGLLGGIVPLSERFLRSLSEEQVAELFANLDELNDEMYDEYSGSTVAEREKNRNKSAIKSIQGFTGRLSNKQRSLVTDALARMDDASEEWIDYQRLWQSKFRELVQSRPPAKEYRQALTELFVNPRNLHSEEYRQRVHNNRMILNGMLEELLAGLSDRQRKRAVRKLDGYADMLDELAAVGAT